MYKKRKKINENAIDSKLESFCEDFLLLNSDAVFAISKKFVENPDKSLKSEIKGLPVIISSININELVIPSGYRLLDNGYLTTWCDLDPLFKMISSEISFSDGEIKGEYIKNLYLDLDSELLSKHKKYSK